MTPPPGIKTDLRNGARLLGTSRADPIVGSGYSDRIIVLSDNDTLTGSAGDDTFSFATGFGHDVITDFVAGSATDDVIELASDIFADIASVLAAATQVGSDVLIAVDANNSITLSNVSLGGLTFEVQHALK